MLGIRLKDGCSKVMKGAGTLLTWGQTTYGWGRKPEGELFSPEIVEGFHDVMQVATGPYHLAFITNSHQVYTCGMGSYGRLGHGSEQTYDYPERVTFFDTNAIEVKELSCGQRHTLALSTAGKVYAWGCGGNTSWVYKTFLHPFKIFRRSSPLGINNLSNQLNPVLVEHLHQPIVSIGAGNDLSVAVGQSGNVYGWGTNLLTFRAQPTSLPQQIKPIKMFMTNNKIKIEKIKVINNFVITLFNDGRLYVLGKNQGGLFGTRNNPLIITDNYHYEMTQVIDDDYKDQRIIDFQVSENSLIFRTESEQIFYSGMYVKYRPEKFPIEIQSIRSIFAVHDSVGVVSTDGKIYYLNDRIIADSDIIDKQVYISEEPKLTSNVLQIGGTHKLFYAIVANQ